jgi:hypothetical protein
MHASFPRLALLTLGLGVVAAAVPACENPVPDVCNLECPAEGILDGNASISGLTTVDSFFSAVVAFNKAALEVQAGVDAELRGIAVSLELDPAAGAADIRGALEAKLKASVDGGLKIDYAPPRCTVAAEVAVDAAAKCDAEVDPGSATVECKGTCTVDASASASCDASATVVCKGTAPDLKCSGTCTGECQGSCEYTAPEGSCEAGAEVRCQAAADASASCDGSCDGEVVPPKAKAECEASVEAEAKLRAECTPPTLEIRWQWSAELEGDVKAQAEFKAWVEGFRGRYGALLAATARSKLVLEAGAGLGSAALDLVANLPGELSGSADLRATLGLACALPELEAVATVITDSSAALSGSVMGAAEITAAIAGG